MKRRLSLSLVLLCLYMITAACGEKSIPTEPMSPVPTITPIPVTASPTLDSPPEVTSTPLPIPPTEELQPTPTLTQPQAESQSTQTPVEEKVQPTATPTEEPDLSVTTLDKPDCVNKAAFFADVTIPDDTRMLQAEAFTKTWRIRNEGTCTWENYLLVYAGGEAMNAAPSNPVQAVAPQGTVDISIDMQAPNRGGSHTSYWQFATPWEENFGVGAGADGLLWVRVVVDYVSRGDNVEGNTTVTGDNCTYEASSAYETQILNLINDARSKAGLGALTSNSQLAAAALKHSIDMGCGDFVNHTGSDGSTWYQRVSEQGFANSNSARENLYVGNPAFGGDAEGAFTWWMNSTIHRENILNNTVSQIGIAYVFTSSSTYGGYYTMVVARP